MKGKIICLTAALGVIFIAVIINAYPVYTTWNLNMNYVDVEAYHCNDNQCASVSGGPFFSQNTGAAYSANINYDVPLSCQTAHYTAYYFFKDCYAPFENYVWSTCDFSVSNNVNMNKKSGCMAEVVSIYAPSSGQTGQEVQISAGVKSAFGAGVSPPDFVPPARKSQYYSSDVKAILTVKKDGLVVFSDSKSMDIFKEATDSVSFSWTPSQPGTYTIEVVTDVTDCICSSSSQSSKSSIITVQSPAPQNSCSDTDGGNAITVLGTTSGVFNAAQYSHSDYCVDSGTVNEYYCSGNLEASSQQGCGTDGYVGNDYCLNGNVYKDFKDYFCSNGACSSSTNPTLQQTCSYGCSNGVCGQQPPVNTPPVIQGIPDFTINAGQTISQIDLFAYASDLQDSDSSLIFSIDSQSNTGVISCYITGNRYLGCGSGQQAGYSDITVRVTDTGGLYDTDTFRITVQSQAQIDHVPVINSVSVTPSHPKDSDDLTCTADVSDQDGNLYSVQFRWFVNGGLEKTRNIYVSGSSASVQDSLVSGISNIGDSVKCEATVYDTTGLQNSDYDTVTIERQDCGVDVYLLETVDNDKIRFRLRNTGQGSEGITYKIYVDSSLIDEETITLESNEWEIVQRTYNFGNGDYLVKVKATADCGDTDSETILHHVEEPIMEKNPEIDSIRITPSDPEEWDDLTCKVDVSDKNGDLDRVRFRWLVEGDLEKTRTVYVSGYSDSAEDTLDSGRFSRGDDVECEATVYDREGRSDSDSQTVTMGGVKEECGVDVYNPKAIGNDIRFEVRNTGHDEEDINYRIYVENELVEEHTIVLDSGERRTVQEFFNFGSSDDYLVKVKVSADCGSTDWESVFHIPGGNCEARYLDDYRCSGLWSQRRYQNSDCSYVWVNMESCPQGCYSGLCSGTPSPGQCGVSIQKFDYQNNVAQNSAASVWVEAKNTGSKQELVKISLFSDGQLRDSYSETLTSGSTLVRLFYHYPSAGTHSLLVKAEADCGSSDTRTATMAATGSGYPVPQPGPKMPTYVSIYPSSLDTSFCESKFITIDVHSAIDQIFTLRVAGIPDEWASYQSQNSVQAGDRKLYIFVGPKEVGMHKITVWVRAEGEKTDFQQEVSIYTAECSQQQQPSGDWITGYLTESTKSPLFWIVLILIVSAVVVLIGVYKFKPDVEYYEPYTPVKPVYYNTQDSGKRNGR